MADPHDLQRFVDAQDAVYGDVADELRRGRKQTHWMWFIFPQLKGLGRSPTALRYGIASRAEAEAYLQHPVLGARLRECTELAIQVERRSANEVFGSPDDLKFRSSMTLFFEASSREDLFRRALDKYFHGEPDAATLDLLRDR